MRHRRGMMGLGALFDPGKPVKGPPLVSSEVGAVISNFLATDKGAPRTVYGGCPKDVKDEVEASDKCLFSSTRSAIAVRKQDGEPVVVAVRSGGRAGDPTNTGTIVSITPGSVNTDKRRRAMANAVLRSLNAGVQVEDRALMKTKERTVGSAVLATASGGRILAPAVLNVPMTEAQIRAAFLPPSEAAVLDPLDRSFGFTPRDVNALISSKSSGKKRRRRRSRK